MRASVVVAHGLSCSAACGISLDQGSNPCPLHWQTDSQPLHHQGSPSAATLEDSSAVSKKLNLLLPYDPVTMLLGIDPNELKTYVHAKTCTQMFIAASFIIAKLETTNMSFSR